MFEDIKILFLDENKEKIWETDYIIDHLFKFDCNKISIFSTLNDLNDESIEFDVLVFNCRKNSLNDILSVVQKIRPKIIIQLSDEYKHENLNSYNILGNYCDLFLRQYHHSGYEYTKNTIHIPLGYCNDAGLTFMNKLPEEMRGIKHPKERMYNWSWFGDIKQDRWDMLNLFSNIPSHSYGTNTSKIEMIEKYLNTIFVPCGRGNSTLECYRLYEASMCGAIPCVVGSVQEIEETFKYMDSPPWIFGFDWNQVVGECNRLLKNPNQLYEMQVSVLKWWNEKNESIRKSILKVLKKKSELKKIEIQIRPQVQHYSDNDEIFGENWFTYHNLYQNVVKEFSSGSKFVEVGCWKGRSSCFLAVEIANSGKNIDFYCVDIWEDLYDNFIENMKPVENYYFPLKISSKDASKKFKDKSLDFVFLDISVDYEDVKRDIETWLPKVKPGGILAGHNYYPDGMIDWFPDVKKAVREKFDYFQEYDYCYVYRVPYDETQKFEGFPSVNFVSVTECSDRRELLYEKFEKYGITNITPHIYDKYVDEDHIIESNMIDRLSIGSRGPVTSHLKAIKEWYYNTDDPYTFMCEDDLGFDTVKYWNFTWKEFFNNLPQDWGCVQLCLLREEFHVFNIGLRNRCWCDWSGCAYLISRQHAKSLIEHYYKDDKFTLDYCGSDVYVREEWAKVPVIETIIYTPFTNVYMFPLFVEDVKNCPSSYINAMGTRTGETNHYHHMSYDENLKWWSTIGFKKNVRDLKVD